MRCNIFRIPSCSDKRDTRSFVLIFVDRPIYTSSCMNLMLMFPVYPGLVPLIMTQC